MFLNLSALPITLLIKEFNGKKQLRKSSIQFKSSLKIQII